MPHKRGNGEGSIYRRKDGRWVGQYLVHTAQGPKYKYIYGRTRHVVAEKLTREMADRDSGLVFDTGSLTLSKYLDRWLLHIRDTVRQRTWERYEQIVRVHLKPALGPVKLKSLTPTLVRSLYREKLNSGLAPRTVRYIHTSLHKALMDAVADGLIPRNVAGAVKAPQPRKKEIKPLSARQAHAFLEVARHDRFEALYVLAIHCGLRKGELLGLKWEDVDLDTRTLAVRRTLSEPKTGHRFEAPKNGKARSIKLTAGAVEALKRHRKRQLEERMQLAGLWEDHGLVFPNKVGKTMNASNLNTRYFKPLLEQAGLPRKVRLHDLRHTCATLLLVKGVHPKIVQELLGHANISQTMDTYSHVLPNMQGEAVAAMQEALS